MAKLRHRLLGCGAISDGAFNKYNFNCCKSESSSASPNLHLPSQDLRGSCCKDINRFRQRPIRKHQREECCKSQHGSYLLHGCIDEIERQNHEPGEQRGQHRGEDLCDKIQSFIEIISLFCLRVDQIGFLKVFTASNLIVCYGF
jgi:hypothetical protein